MRYTRLLLFSFFSFTVLGFSQNQINPANQIRWPVPACLSQTAAYIPGINTCDDISHIPPSSITWPVPCNGVYSPSTNTCVPTGTANNPGGASGDAQMNSGGNFATATDLSISKSLHDAASGSFLMTTFPMTAGFPFPPSTQLKNELILGDQAAQDLGAYTQVVTTGSASSGSQALTVASATGIYQYNMVSAPGIGNVFGTNTNQVSSISGTTITLSQPTTAAVTGPIIFTAGPTNGLVAIGNQACQHCQSNNGSVVIGVGALQNDVGYAGGGEDQNGVFIGPYAGAGETGAATCAYNTLASGGSGVFEPVLIGNKVGQSGCGWSGTQMIGNHIFNIAGATNSTLIGNEVGPGGPAGNVTVIPSGVVVIGRNAFNNSLRGAQPPNGVYNVSSTDCIGYGNCADAFSQLNFVFGNSSFNGPNNGTVITGIRNDVFGDNIANQCTSCTNNVLIGGGSGGSATAAAITTGQNNVIVGHSAGIGATSLTDSVIIGFSAAQLANANPITAVGRSACGAATGAQVVCIGYFASPGLSSGTQDVIISPASNAGGSGPTTSFSQGIAIGPLAGLGESGTQETYVGFSTGRRGTPSAGTNTAYGAAEFVAVGGTAGTEQYDLFAGDNSNCNGCTSSVSLGHTANIGGTSLTHAVQIDAGTNATSHTMQWQTINFLDDAGNMTVRTTAVRTVPTIASASTITPTSSLIKVSGTAAVLTITPPTVAQNGGVFLGCIDIIPTGTFLTQSTGGNIAQSSSMVVNRVNHMCYDGSLWYPSY